MKKSGKDVKGSKVLPPVLVILGGILVLISGIYSYLLRPQYATSPNFTTFVQFGLNSNLTPLTIVLGLMIIGTGVLLFTENKIWATMWSGTGLIFGILSIFGGGGFLLGMALVFIGSFLKLFYASSS